MEKLVGLSPNEVEERRKSFGPNEISSRVRFTWWNSLRSVFSEPMVLILIACSLIYFIFGEASDATVLSISVLVVGGISFFQDFKTGRSLAALRQLSSPRAFVRRNGESLRISGKDVVVDDLLILREGDRVAADASIIEGTNLLLDESLLTGESVAIIKSPNDSVFSGSLIVRGNGLARVVAIGSKTRLGQISRLLESIDETFSPLQKQAGKLAKRLGILALVICLVTIAFYGSLRDQWTSAFLAGLTLAVALMPEELPLIMTIFFAMGAWRMSKKQMLTRKIAAIESLGSIQVLCTDKTGTITHGKSQKKR